MAEPFAPGQRIGVEDLLGARVRVFDTNPAQPKSYALQLGLQGGRTEHQVRFPIKLDSTGHAEVRLIDYQRNIVSQLGMTDQLDAAVAIRLLMAEQPAGEIQIARYVASLSREGQCVSLQTGDLSTFPLEKLRAAEVFARPSVLRDAEQRTLRPQESEGTPTGNWLATELDGCGNPWLIYPGPDSVLQFRPMVWIADEAEAAPKSTVAGEKQRTLPAGTGNAAAGARSAVECTSRCRQDHGRRSRPRLMALGTRPMVSFQAPSSTRNRPVADARTATASRHYAPDERGASRGGCFMWPAVSETRWVGGQSLPH